MSSNVTKPTDHAQVKLRSLILLPLVLFVSIAAVSVMRWRQELDEQAEALRRQTQVAEEQFARRLEEAAEQKVRPLRQLRRAWLLGNVRTQGEFAAAAAPIWHDHPSYRMVGWISPGDSVVRLVSPLAGNESLLGQDLRELPHWREALLHARQHKADAAGPLHNDPEHGWVSSLVVPIFSSSNENGSDSSTYHGAVIGQCDVSTTLATLIDARTLNDFHITIYDGPRVIYDTRGQYHPQPALVEPVRMLNHELQLSLVPTAAFIDSRRSSEPSWVLWGGFAGALLISLAVFQALAHRSREQRRSQTHLEALESLNQITAAITAKAAGSGHEVLDRLTATACALLHADRAVILMLDEQDASLIHTLAVFGDQQHPRTYRLSDLPITRQCIETQQVAVVEDTHADAERVNAAHVANYGYRAVLAVPLRVEDKSIGALVVTHSAPCRFREAEINLARVWGSHAAVTLVNMRLHDRMEQALREQEKLAQYGQALAEVSAAVYQAGTVEESMRTIAELSPRALGVDMCVADLVVGPDELVVSAATGAFADLIVGHRVNIVGTNVGRAFESRRMLVIEDAVDDGSVHPVFRSLVKVGSIIYAPLFRADGSPLGVLIFVRHEPSRFSSQTLTLAEVFARRAAGALENAQLHENARRDAETKAMLLRELNHRVKNNLAGIVGLLTTNEPDLPADARQWLDRVIERIGTMARAHHLFSGGMERVGLSELVEQIVPSLSVIKPPGITVRTDLGEIDGGASLRVERAVSVAMVLHELCTNAILHGIGDSAAGVVTVRARGLEDRRLAIDVMDDGRGLNDPDSPCHDGRNNGDNDRAPMLTRTTGVATRSGLGLTLVEGLVKRELNGQFTITCPPQGGTVATVVFPLLPDETQETYL